LVLTRLETGPPRARGIAIGEARPLVSVLRQPAYVLAVAAAVVSYAVMSFIMTATPISMHVHDHHSDVDTAWVIQSHLLAMYGPSLFTGRLIGRIGVRAGMGIGLTLMLVCVVIDSAGRDLMHYWWGLVTLGVGWNLLFVAGTALLTTTYLPAERYRAQAVNEFAVFGTQALASLLAGPAIHLLGWRSLNLATLLPLVLFAAALLAWPVQRSRNSRR
jgi:MFS family permease